jgi:hypothetical protein
MNSRFLTRLVAIAGIAISACGFDSSLMGAPLESVDVPNGSFENPASAGDNFVNTPGSPSTQTLIQDWTINVQNNSTVGTQNYTSDPTITGGTGNQGAFVSSAYGYFESDLISGNVTNYSGAAGQAGNTGVLAYIEPLTTYQLTLDIGVPTSQGNPALSDAPGVIINLIDPAGNFFASNSSIYNNSASVYYAGGIPFSSLSYGSMTQYTLTITTGATIAAPFFVGDGLKAEVSLYNGNNVNSVGGIVVDNVQFADTIAAPEPSTYTMIGLGLLSLLAIGKFRKLAA